LKPATAAGFVVAIGDRLPFLRAHDRGDVTGARSAHRTRLPPTPAASRTAGQVQPGRQQAADRFAGMKLAKHRGDGGGGGLESRRRRNTTGRWGSLRGDARGFQRRADRAHIGPRRRGACSSVRISPFGTFTGTRQHVPESRTTVTGDSSAIWMAWKIASSGQMQNRNSRGRGSARSVPAGQRRSPAMVIERSMPAAHVHDAKPRRQVQRAESAPAISRAVVMPARLRAPHAPPPAPSRARVAVRSFVAPTESTQAPGRRSDAAPVSTRARAKSSITGARSNLLISNQVRGAGIFTGYFAGLSSPSVTDNSVTFAMLAEVEGGGAHQIADILDEQDVEIVEFEIVQRLVHHVRVEVTGGAGGDLQRPATPCARIRMGVVLGLQVAFDDADAEFVPQRVDRRLQQRGSCRKPGADMRFQPPVRRVRRSARGLCSAASSLPGQQAA